MSLSFDMDKFIVALPGGLCLGKVKIESNNVKFAEKKFFCIPERRLNDFMKILQCLSKNIVLEETVEKGDTETMECGETVLTTHGNKLQCQVKNQYEFELDFVLSTFLSFLICARKVSFWIVGPTQTEYEIMDFFVRRTVNKSVGFPRQNQIEEDIKGTLEEHDFSNGSEMKFYLHHFLLNHHSLLEFQYNLFCLTTKN